MKTMVSQQSSSATTTTTTTTSSSSSSSTSSRSTPLFRVTRKNRYNSPRYIMSPEVALGEYYNEFTDNDYIIIIMNIHINNIIRVYLRVYMIICDFVFFRSNSFRVVSCRVVSCRMVCGRLSRCCGCCPGGDDQQQQHCRGCWWRGEGTKECCQQEKNIFVIKKYCK